MTTPYTYLIKCIPTQEYYYGVSWKKGCDPSDLWNTYFTSSNYVKKLIHEYGKNAFEVEIRKTFEHPIEAKKWESKVIRRMNLENRNDFLNKCRCIDFKSRVWIQKDEKSKFIDVIFLEDYLLNGWSKGRYFSEEHRKKNSISVKKYAHKNGSTFKNKTHSLESRQKMSEKRKGKYLLGDRPSAKRIEIDGVVYGCIKEAMQKLHLSRYLCLKKGKLFNETSTSP